MKKALAFGSEVLVYQDIKVWYDLVKKPVYDK
jgi:hypothetical protein